MVDPDARNVHSPRKSIKGDIGEKQDQQQHAQQAETSSVSQTENFVVVVDSPGNQEQQQQQQQQQQLPQCSVCICDFEEGEVRERGWRGRRREEEKQGYGKGERMTGIIFSRHEKGTHLTPFLPIYLCVIFSAASSGPPLPSHIPQNMHRPMAGEVRRQMEDCVCVCTNEVYAHAPTSPFILASFS